MERFGYSACYITCVVKLTIGLLLASQKKTPAAITLAAGGFYPSITSLKYFTLVISPPTTRVSHDNSVKILASGT